MKKHVESEMDEYLAQQEVQRGRSAINAKLPEVGQRVFNLRGKDFFGAGSHWSLESMLGALLVSTNNRSNYSHDDLVRDKARYEFLQNAISRHEAWAKDAKAKSQEPDESW